MQVRTNTEVTLIISDLVDFYNFVEDELDSCHPEAFDMLYDIIDKPHHDNQAKEFLSDFMFEYGDELEGCHTEGYEKLKEIMTRHDIE